MSGENIDSSEIPEELRTVAILVWHHQRMRGDEAWTATIKTNAEQGRRIERFRQELHRIVGERDDISLKINGGCVEAEVEDLRFVAFDILSPNKQETRPVVTLLGRCPLCGIETVSEPFFSLAGLGQMLEKFEPSNKHFCHTS